jgi:hypothetical protein
MTRVMLGQSVVPVFIFTMHDHVRPIGGNGRRGEVPRGPRLARGLHASLGRDRSMQRGSGALVLMLQESGALMTSWDLGEAEGVPKPRAI